MCHAYVEPYAGMLGTLLCRPPAKQEIVNDTNDALVAWWTCLPDQPEELERLVTLTPISRTEYDRAKKIVQQKDAETLRKALAFDTILRYGVGARTDKGTNFGYTAQYSGSKRWVSAKFERLAARVHNVQIENKDAIDVLKFTATLDDVTVYCDPPYYSAARRYANNDVDVQRLTDALQAQKGVCAVSGYGDEWDHLGWRRHEKETVCTIKGNLGPRTEVLWMNQDKNGDLFNDGAF